LLLREVGADERGDVECEKGVDKRGADGGWDL
jgi:hypothetical protein